MTPQTLSNRPKTYLPYIDVNIPTIPSMLDDIRLARLPIQLLQILSTFYWTYRASILVNGLDMHGRIIIPYPSRKIQYNAYDLYKRQKSEVYIYKPVDISRNWDFILSLFEPTKTNLYAIINMIQNSISEFHYRHTRYPTWRSSFQHIISLILNEMDLSSDMIGYRVAVGTFPVSTNPLAAKKKIGDYYLQAYDRELHAMKGGEFDLTTATYINLEGLITTFQGNSISTSEMKDYTTTLGLIPIERFKFCLKTKKGVWTNREIPNWVKKFHIFNGASIISENNKQKVIYAKDSESFF